MKIISATCGLLITFLPCLAGFGQQQGKIEGVVRNEQGIAVAGATVKAQPEGVVLSSAVPQIETDAGGRFEMDHLPSGTYKIFAMKESAGYPDTSFAFYSNQRFPKLVLRSDAQPAEIVLRIGPPGGIMTGIVSDAVTGRPVAASFILRRVSDSRLWISMAQRSDYRVLLPPDVEVAVEVSADGYSAWHYGDSVDRMHRRPIRLRPGEEKKLNVSLQPSATKAGN
jgi:hypothetical protein